MAPKAPSKSIDSVIINQSIKSEKSKSKRDNPAKWWCFTFNNYTEENIDQIVSWFHGSNHSYIFQEEIGEKEKTPHLQGTVCFTSKVRPTENKKHINGMMWSKTRSVSHATAYCEKAETRSGRQWSNIPAPIELILIQPKDFKPWMKDIIAICDKGVTRESIDFRTIYWYWEPTGNVGKTAIAKYICVKYNAIVVSGKSNDCKNAILQYYNAKKMYPEIVIFDIPRCNQNHISYDGLESIKNGFFYSGKYEGGMCYFNNPHVFCFANEEPDLVISDDKWKIIRIEV